MALYPGAVLRLIPPGSNDPRITARVLIFHVAVSEAASLYDQFAGPSGIESHFYVRRDGTIEQYRDTGWQADANCDANDFAISVETQGMAEGQWTDAQIASLKAITLWCHAVHGIPLRVCPTWDGSGVGYHILFMARWAGGPRACPGPDRIAQFNAVLVPWLAHPTLPLEPDMTPAESALLTAINTRLVQLDGIIRDTYNRSEWNRVELVAARPVLAQVTALKASVAALLAADPNMTAEQITAIIHDAITSQVDVHGTLTIDPKAGS